MSQVLYVEGMGVGSVGGFVGVFDDDWWVILGWLF